MLLTPVDVIRELLTEIKSLHDGHTNPITGKIDEPQILDAIAALHVAVKAVRHAPTPKLTKWLHEEAVQPKVKKGDRKWTGKKSGRTLKKRST